MAVYQVGEMPRIRSVGGLALHTCRRHPALVAGICFSLLLLALSQAGAILLVKAFLAVFFGGVGAQDGNETSITLARLVSIDARALKGLAWLPGNPAESIQRILGQQVPISALYLIIPSAVLLAGLVKSAASYAYNRMQQDFSLFAGASLRDSLFGTILRKPYPELAATSPAGWMSIVINDVAFVQARLSEFMSSFLRGGVAVIASLVTMTLIHWPSALVLIGIMPLAARATGRTGKKIAGFSAAVQQAMRVMTSLVLEVRGRFDFMRVQHGEEFDLGRFRNINESWFRTICRSILVRSTFAPALEFAGFAIFAAFIFALDRQWIGGGDTGGVAAGDFALQFVVALGFMVKPLREIGEQLTRYHETRGAVGKCFEMITPPVSEAAGRSPDSKELSLGQEISIRGVSFRWSGQVTGFTADLKDAPALNSSGFAFCADGRVESAPLTIAPGRAVAVVGPSGSGKSSMLKVFSGLARPQSWDANVLWDDLANSTALVPQQPYLFAASVRQNICYGSGEPSDEAIFDTIELMGLSELIESLPAGIGTHVSSLTSNLSGGQIQRLVIARAWLRQKRLLLLDEATSALDPATEAAIMQRVVKAVRGSGRALLAVTHRLQCLELFDEIWFVEEGHISLRGSRDQLMREPRFREFCQVHS